MNYCSTMANKPLYPEAYDYPVLNKLAANCWVWSNTIFLSLKEAKTFLDNNIQTHKLHTLITEYEGYDTICHYDKNGILSSTVKIIPDETSYHRYHYGKPHRV